MSRMSLLEWVMLHINASCHVWTSHVTYELVAKCVVGTVTLMMSTMVLGVGCLVVGLRFESVGIQPHHSGKKMQEGEMHTWHCVLYLLHSLRSSLSV